jgi:hypothetical protein
MPILKINNVSGTFSSGTDGTSGSSQINGKPGASGTSSQPGTSGTSDVNKTTDVTLYTTPGNFVWTKPTGAILLDVICIGAGGGGGSGRRGASSTARFGGNGGFGGGYSRATFDASYIGSTVSVTVGSGGSGGAAQTVNTSNGNAGTAGGNSSFGNLIVANGGDGGGAGTTLPSLLRSQTGGLGVNERGGDGDAPTGVPIKDTVFAPGGGGYGGNYTATNVTNSGSIGGAAQLVIGSISDNAGAPGFGGTAGGDNLGLNYIGEGGGGGGSGTLTLAGGTGGAGGDYGAGGGGGGGSLNGFNSGAGGSGANGIVVVVTYY